jgi:hypothetical protein
LPANAAVLVGGGERVNNHNSPNRAEWYNPEGVAELSE